MAPNLFRRIALAQGLLPEAAPPRATPSAREEAGQPPGHAPQRDGEGPAT